MPTNSTCMLPTSNSMHACASICARTQLHLLKWVHIFTHARTHTPKHTSRMLLCIHSHPSTHQAAKAPEMPILIEDSDDQQAPDGTQGQDDGDDCEIIEAVLQPLNKRSQRTDLLGELLRSTKAAAAAEAGGSNGGDAAAAAGAQAGGGGRANGRAARGRGRRGRGRVWGRGKGRGSSTEPESREVVEGQPGVPGVEVDSCQDVIDKSQALEAQLKAALEEREDLTGGCGNAC